ncbi:MAG: septation protein SpoVG family protein [Planctomycetes bacterium]|nr:septation protein SpoVG family protein [Planctomycetota bacterium]
MEITDVRVKLVSDSTDRLKAYCTVTFDDQFVVRDIKVVDGTNGLFVAMPSRKRSVPCGGCGHRNQVRARFCEDCGVRMPAEAPPVETDARSRIHRDIAHPITPSFRELLQNRVIEGYRQELRRSRDPDYLPQDEEVAEVAEPVEPTVAAEPVDEAETVELNYGNSEYDSLIAGLKSGYKEVDDAPASRPRPAPAGRRPQPSRGPERNRQDQPQRRQPSGDRPRESGPGGNRGQRPQEQAGRPGQRPPMSKPRSAEGRPDAGRRQERAAAPAGANGPDRGPGRDRPAEPRPAREPVRQPVPEAPKEAPAASSGGEDELPFGAGIL